MSNPIIYLTKLMWQFSQKRQVVWFYFLFLGSNTVDFFRPLIIGKVLNVIQEQGVTSANIWFIGFLLLTFIGVTLLFWCFHGPGRIKEMKNAFIVRARYKKYLLEGTMQLAPGWHTEHHSGDTIDKVQKATDSLYQFSSENFIIIESVLRLVGSYVALAYFNVHAAYIVAVLIVMTIGLIFKYDKRLILQWSLLLKAENRVSAKVFDTISNITTIIILRVEKLVSRSIMDRIWEPYVLYKKNININEMKWFLVSVCSACMTFLVLFTYIFTNYKTGLLIGTIFVLYEFVGRINSLFFRFAYKYSDIVQQRTAVENVEEISAEFRKKKRSRQFSLSRWKTLRIAGLAFAYHADGKHLDDLTLTIKRKQKIALIGSSGSGKTTFLKVLRDLYHPEAVHVSVDGKEVPRGFAGISSSIALIPQDPEIFSSSIRDNITLGLSRSDAQISQYTNIARFSEVIARLPHGLDSSIVEKGVNLSGGEKQRLALARGLLAAEDKEILLLDEPTSSVDSKNELLIYEGIFRACKQKTIVSSIHRLHLLPLFDQIYFFKRGKIIAAGSFDELLRESLEFKRLWRRYQR